jgi:hypothetical protein
MTVTATTPPLAPQLAAVKEQYLLARERLRHLCKGLTEETWAAGPPGGGWSVAECVVHLNLTTDSYLPKIDAAIDEGLSKRLEGSGPFGRGVLGALLIWWLEPPYKRGSKTTPAFVPSDVPSMAETLELFDLRQQELQGRVDRAAGLALDKLKVTSAFDARVSYNLYATFAILAAHQRRHLWQAEQVRADVSRPAGSAASA